MAAGQVGDEWQDRGPWLLLPLLLIVALAFRRGWLLLLPLVLMPMWPVTAEATTWHDLWQRPDQQAAQALRNGDAKRAQQLAHDPAWRGAAAYRAGDYATATQALQRAPGSDAAYNRGNALARQGQYQQAIDAYDHALKLDPAHADAKANRQAVEDWLRQQKQKQQPQDNKDHKGENGKNGKGQSASGEQGKDSKAGSAQAQDDKSQQGDGKSFGKTGQDEPSKTPDQNGENRSAKDQAGDQPKPLTPQQQAEQKAHTEQAQKALQQQLDQALAGQQKVSTGSPQAHQLGAMSQDDPQAKLPADLRHALQRVPDDPGALLRRKFELEYQQRHGGTPDEDGQP
jgi:Ca-activated chloride channel family protein